MSVRLSYRRKITPKKNCKNYRKQSFTVYKYRDENGIEQYKITKSIKWGKYRNVNDGEKNQQLLQNSSEE